jgi:8-oxo-dGTP diphosphatase
MWVVTHYLGEPRGLDGQALRWCTHEELEASDLLPADRPIVRALKLPERLTRPDTSHFEVKAWPEVKALLGVKALRSPPAPVPAPRGGAGGGKLQGVLCSAPEDGTSAAGLGADFVVLDRELTGAELKGLCDSVCLPVFARGLRLETAWALGATGLSELSR